MDYWLKILILFVLNILLSSCNLQTLEYYEPGNYILDKSDYANSDNIIIELWGAGSGGNWQDYYDCDQRGCFQDGYTYYGGNSGAYVKFNIITQGESFNFTIGSGSISGPYYLNYYGGSSSFNNADNTINIIAGGGPPNNQSLILAQPSYYINSDRGYLINQAYGNLGIVTLSKYIDSANGASTNFGPLGANSNNAYDISSFTPGGGGCCLGPKKDVTQGGNGGIIIYFSSPFSPSISATASSTISVTKSISITRSPLPSRSTTSTPLPSKSLSPSPLPSFVQVMQDNEKQNDHSIIVRTVSALIIIIPMLVCMILLCRLTFYLLHKNMVMTNQLKKLDSCKTKGECIICYAYTQVNNCKFNHGICRECLIKIGTFECTICHDSYV